ncbi:MAG: hypothetical protein QY325_12060 [Flavobacteriales bacterium]|jgi:hypothetical protein|nr:MAG: hypothetical protein QY325_12060 [Flavobacteriales bacterium]
MKTPITRYLLVLASVLTMGYARAAEPVVRPVARTEASALDRSLERALSRHMTFPWLAQGDMTGKVYVSFNIDTEGKVQVLSCSSANERLKDYVLRKLARVDIGDNPDGIWRTTHLVIDFHPEAKG